MFKERLFLLALALAVIALYFLNGCANSKPKPCDFICLGDIPESCVCVEEMVGE